jgi:hypothetical protein
MSLMTATADASPSPDAPERKLRQLRFLMFTQLLIGTAVVLASGYALVVIQPLFRDRHSLEIQVHQLRQERQILAADTIRLRTTITTLAAQKTSLARGLSAWVQRDVIPVAYIEYAPGVDTTKLHNLRATLRSHWIAAAGGQRVKAPPHSKVVYYYSEDRGHADEVAKLTADYYRSIGCIKEPFELDQEVGPRQGALEVWVNAGCRKATVPNQTKEPLIP